jgi:hypothetical protein
MVHVVLRLYTDPGELIGKIRDSEAEVRELLGSIPGFRTYGMSDSVGGGAVTITACDDKAGCDESSRRAAEWVRTNLPNAKIAPPQVIEGEGVFRILTRVAKEQPHIVVRLFSEPVPARIKESEANIRELLTAVVGFRMYSVIDASTEGVSIMVGDDKASTDALGQRMRAWVEAKLGEAPRNPQVIEGEGVFRFTAEDVAARA